MKMKVDILPFVEELEGEVVNGHLSNAQKCFSDVLDKSHRCCHFKFFLTANVFFCWCLLIHSALVFPPTCHTMFNENWVVSPPSVSAACNSNVTPRNWTRLPQSWLLLDLILGWVLFRHTNSSCADTPHEFDEQQRTHITCTTPSNYLSVYAQVAPHTPFTPAYMHTPYPQTPANWPDRPAADIIHLPAREEGPLCRLSPHFFSTGCQLILSASLPGAVLSTLVLSSPTFSTPSSPICQQPADLCPHIA